MKFLTWNNKALGDFDVFGIFSKEETIQLSKVLGNEIMDAACFDKDGERFFFINSKSKKICPMKLLSFAFGGQYNGDTPYGDEIKDFLFVASEYTVI